ncbi:hypothetical protein [Candidatus Palauibacter sp.]
MSPRVSSVASPVSTSTSQMEPAMPTAMEAPSGDQDGNQGVVPGAGGR